jgi:transposase InsO family protein
VRRPTDNAITERFYGTIKQEEIYVVESYPDLQSAKEEIGKYIKFYNERRPHQSLWNFTPQAIHELNNKTQALNTLKQLKQKTLTERRAYWVEQQKMTSQKI